MTKAVLIDSAAQTIRQVTVTNLKDMQQHVGGYIDIAFTWETGDTLYVDEEALLKPQEHFFRISTRPDQPLAGNGLIVGSDDEGENSDVMLTVDEVMPLITFYSRAQAQAWAKGNASEPAVTISSIGPNGEIDRKVIARYGTIFANMPKEQ